MLTILLYRIGGIFLKFHHLNTLMRIRPTWMYMYYSPFQSAYSVVLVAVIPCKHCLMSLRLVFRENFLFRTVRVLFSYEAKFSIYQLERQEREFCRRFDKTLAEFSFLPFKLVYWEPCFVWFSWETPSSFIVFLFHVHSLQDYLLSLRLEVWLPLLCILHRCEYSLLVHAIDLKNFAML